MTTLAKIRLLLAIVCATFLLTAIIVKETFTPKVNLEQSGGIIERNLNKKEAIVKKLIADTAEFNKLKTISANPKTAYRFIQHYTSDNRIWISTFVNNRAKFWTGVKFFPEDPARITDGVHFYQRPNGAYELIKKSDGAFSVIFIIPVKNIYHFNNRYLKNGFDQPIMDDDHVDIADITDRTVYHVHSIDDRYLFSIKLKPGHTNHRFYEFEFILWLMGILALCTLIHSICNYIVGKGYPLLSFMFMAAFIAASRYLNIMYDIPAFSEIDLFNPRYYSANFWFPSLGHFCLNILFSCWLAGFIYRHRQRVIKKQVEGAAAYVLVGFLSVVLIGLAALLLSFYYGLIVRSIINFDVTNVFNLSGYSYIGVLMLCFSFLLFFLISDTFLTISKKIMIPDRHKAGIFAAVVLLATSATLAYKDLSAFFVLAGLFTLIRAYSVWYDDGKLSATSFLCLITVCALISSTKLNHFLDIKHAETRIKLIKKLEVAKDEKADTAFFKIERQMATDPELIKYFGDKDHNDDFLRTHFQKNYFDGYLNKYDVKLHIFDPAGVSITNDKTYQLSYYKDMVVFGALTKVSENFYHENDGFGYQKYFAILPINTRDSSLGTLVVTLVSKPLMTGKTFPELLVDGESRPDEAYQDYSYAFYFDNKLMIQAGKLTYKLNNADFKGKVKEYVTQMSPAVKPNILAPLARTRHLIYQPEKRKMIVVSIEEDPIARSVTSLTFFFVFLLAFSWLVIFFSWIWSRIRIFNIKNKRIKWGFKLTVERVLYRSRIQFSVIFTVVFTLLMVGGITFQYITTQYREQQDEMIREKINRIGAVFEAGLSKGQFSASHMGEVNFNEFADTYLSDLTLYSKEGIEILTTQPKLYTYGLLAERMNGKAYIAMNSEQRSEFVNDERLGELKYKAAYVPIVDERDNKVYYLQLPYFSNETDIITRIGSLLNTMINIYALVFIAIGLVAVVIARQITSPLNFIQQNFSRTIYGEKNEPIVWDRDDEIGSLVKEYNKMIAALEDSAQRLARSERESAWREMAKQVAHEIKNPLTPLKLGLQLLDKAWKDKDPKFDQKFERFSKSFVEQIESLSQIASEFSSFAKMPDTKLQKVSLFEVIGQAVIIFKQMDNVTINYEPGEQFIINADRDQLLRCYNNLLKNAIEAIPEERHGVISIEYKIGAGNILMTVTDNGNGIPEEMREKIFAPNFTTKSSGTGLGLAFVKNSIENAGGKVWFETEIGVGTTFFLSFPETD
ncbi:sensor histidine kinase [Mucilaginibacter myungsuensis]|uniref:histidine kinase n=1 Tax=Mucilaginibacter myungsuensis TaxID=649104 RepID=A0A929KWC2_9SPHI|nr:ATP-binding protein [Mucilaginibacter myungsuensis]MBE9661660.1 GHKL domain-containing protein [Mucilaginibacter myungsuensis]MDN3597804.1 ATP-binding protein [Mucilaginibacter myungsuensis]